jgi:3-oxoacid CoA-transferase subunit B
VLRGGLFFDSPTSFVMIRDGHIDTAVLGAIRVSVTGDLANRMVPGALVKGMGGAMDLVSGVGRVLVVMDHVTKQGEPKLLASCTRPLTGRRVLTRVITDLAVFDVTGSAFHVVELASGVTLAEVMTKTCAAVTAKTGALPSD